MGTCPASEQPRSLAEDGSLLLLALLRKLPSHCLLHHVVFISFPGVLVSAGIELIFFLVAGIVQCFGFSVRIMLITR